MHMESDKQLKEQLAIIINDGCHVQYPNILVIANISLELAILCEGNKINEESIFSFLYLCEVALCFEPISYRF